MAKEVAEKTLMNIRRPYLICLLLVITTLAVYWPVNGFEFIDYDDDLYVVENYPVQSGLNQKSIVWAFRATDAANWHPLTWLSHMLDIELYGQVPGGHHVTNLIFHITNVVLFFLVFWQMTGMLWQSAFLAALFGLHPLHVESVAQIAERKDVLSTFFWALTLLAYGYFVKRPGIGRYFLVIFCFSLGLMSKPMLVTLPFVLLLLDYWPLRRFQFKFLSDANLFPQRPSVFFLVYEKIPLFVLTAASSVVTYLVQQKGGAIRSLEVFPFDVRIANALNSYVAYIGKMLWPARLSFLYPHPGRLPAERIAAALFVLVAISLLAIRFTKKRPYLTVGWLWYLGTLFPVIGLVQVGSQAMADRYTYVPLIGLFVMISWGIPDLFLKWRHKAPGLALMAAGVLSALMLTTWIQLSYWKNSFTLFEHAIEVTTDNAAAHNNLGVALEATGRSAEALKHFLEVLRIDPGDSDVHNNLGLALMHLGKVDQAIAHFHKALRRNPNMVRAYNNFGNALASQGHTDKAIEQYKRAIKIDPDYKEAYYNLGNAYFKPGSLDRAIEYYQAALRIDPFYAGAHNNLGVALLKQAKLSEAAFQFRKALQINPEYTEARQNLNQALSAQKTRDHAILALKEKLALNPDDPKLHTNIGDLYKAMGDFDQAAGHYEKALHLSPAAAEVLNRLAIVYAIRGEFNKARVLFKKVAAFQPERPDAYYFIAGTYARQKRVEEAINWLDKSIRRGFDNWDLLKNDKNMENIRSTSYYRSLMYTK